MLKADFAALRQSKELWGKRAKIHLAKITPHGAQIAQYAHFGISVSSA